MLGDAYFFYSTNERTNAGQRNVRIESCSTVSFHTHLQPTRFTVPDLKGGVILPLDFEPVFFLGNTSLGHARSFGHLTPLGASTTTLFQEEHL